MTEMQVFDTPEKIRAFRLRTLRGALKLEILGMKRRGRSACSVIKDEFRLKGGREKVLAQLDALISADESEVAK